MAALTKTELKARFETKDRPTGADFAALIDAFLLADFTNWPDVLPAASGKNLTEIEPGTTVNAWVDVAAAAGFVATDELAFVGNQEAVFVVGRRVRMTLDAGFAYSEVLSATYSAGSNSTTVVLADAVADATIEDIDVSLFLPVSEGGAVGLGTLGGTAFAATLLDDPDAATARATLGVNAASESAAGLIELATAAEALAASATNRGVTPANLRDFLRGVALPFVGTTTPPWGLECNGQNVSRTTYAELFARIGTTWGAGDGSTTFTLPDFRRRTLVGKGGTGTGTLGNGVGATGGAETANLQHTHPVNINSQPSVSSLAFTIGGGSSTVVDTHIHQVQGDTSNGGSTAQSIMQPSAVVGWFIVF